MMKNNEKPDSEIDLPYKNLTTAKRSNLDHFGLQSLVSPVPRERVICEETFRFLFCVTVLFYCTICLSLIDTVNTIYVFPLTKTCYKKTRTNVKFSLYLKGWFWAAEIQYTHKNTFYVVSVTAFIFSNFYVKPIRSPLI